MNIKTLTNEDLAARLEKLQQAAAAGNTEDLDQLQEAVHELQVHRFELEMQNRALRETQAELEQAVRRYTDLYDFSPVGYLSLTPQGRIAEINLTAADMFREARRKILGSFLARYVHDGDVPRIAEHIEQCFQTHGVVVMDLSLHLREEGILLPVQLSSRLASHPAETEPLIRTTLTDISALKETQQRLREINREQESFCYSISHDLRSPLITLANFSTLLMEDHAEQLGAEGRSHVERMHAATVRMDRLLRDLLNYSRVSRAEVMLTPVELEKLVDDVVSQHQGAIEERRAVIEVRRPMPRVFASYEALGQAVANLVMNALKFTPPERTPRVEIFAEPREKTTVLTVADNGIGIAPAHHSRVFEIFERLHNKQEYPGTGVGLAIVRRAVERMGGNIRLDSEPGQGSRFHIELATA